MSKVFLEIVKWPYGISIDIGNKKGSTTVAGKHGGGVGTVEKRFEVDAEKLIKIIKEKEF